MVLHEHEYTIASNIIHRITEQRVVSFCSRFPTVADANLDLKLCSVNFNSILVKRNNYDILYIFPTKCGMFYDYNCTITNYTIGGNRYIVIFRVDAICFSLRDRYNNYIVPITIISCWIKIIF